ncbi:MAG: MFS transporter [Alphaproteobacteria bacterium]|nr:MFS transporter [Alphaproteobacteria bacterium]
MNTALLLVATTAVQVVLSLACLALPAIAPKVAGALGVPAALVGYWVSLVYGGAMVSTLMGGPMVRRFGATRISQAALTLGALGMVLASVAWLPVLAAAALLTGLGYGLVNPASSLLLARAAGPRNRNLIFSIKQTGVPLGGMLAGLAAPPLAQAFGWQWAPAGVAVLCLALALGLQPWRAAWDADRDPGARFRENPLAGLALIWGRPALRFLSLAAFAFAVVQLCLTAFTVTMLVEEAGYGLVAAGAVMSVVQFSGVAGRLLWGLLADRLGSLAVLALIAVVMAGAAAITAQVAPSWPQGAVVALLFVFGLSAIGWNGVYLAEVARITPLDEVSRATGASLFFTFGGVLVGPSAFALLVGPMGGYGATYGLLAVVGAAGLGLILLAITRRAPGARPGTTP